MRTDDQKVSVQAPRGIPPQKIVEYVDRCRGNVNTLAAALDRSDFQFVQVFGHRIRGTGGAYGIPKITEFGGLIESAAIERNQDEIRRLAEALEGYLDRLEVAGS